MTKTQAVQRLLAEGKSYREISKLVGVSYAAVSKIKCDSLGPYKPKKPAALRTPIRCRGCGGNVFIFPCLVCVTEAAKKKERVTA